mmetsp:Transcript_40650/g.97440  ORF Transcript_40650/g.97440 Transcript_40650/m.97440 type:complete len:213 (-) Transcript_40650:1075-1713(-)
MVSARECLKLTRSVAQHIPHDAGDQLATGQHLHTQDPLNHPARIRLSRMPRAQNAVHPSYHRLHHPGPHFVRSPLQERLNHVVTKLVPTQLVEARFQDPFQSCWHFMLNHTLKNATAVLVPCNLHSLRHELVVNHRQRTGRYDLQDFLNHMVAMQMQSQRTHMSLHFRNQELLPSCRRHIKRVLHNPSTPALVAHVDDIPSHSVKHLILGSF